MRRFLNGIIFGFLFAVVMTPAQAQEPPVLKFYGADHMLVEYEISGAAVGKETLQFDQWGMRQARTRIAETQKWGVTTLITLNLAEQVILMDPNKSLGQKSTDENLKKLLASPPPAEAGLLAVQMAALLGGKIVGTEKVLDRPCDIWDIPTAKTKVWLWNGIPLKSETQTPDGPVNYKAVALDEATLIDENIFSIPPSVHFIDRDINEILIS